MRRRNLRNLVVSGAILFATASAHAAMVRLDGAGFDVWYDSSMTGLFGTPTLSGGTVFFTPSSFSAKSDSTTHYGEVINYSTLNLRITLDDGYFFDSVGLTERGGYRLRGTDSEAQVLGQTTVFDVDTPFVEFSDSVSPSGPINQTDGAFHNWSASSFLDLSGAAWRGTHALSYTLDNLLSAYSNDAGVGPRSSFISKNFVGLDIGVVPVPEPETYAMFMAGLGMVGLMARRRMLGM